MKITNYDVHGIPQVSAGALQISVGIVGMEFAIVSMTLLLLVHRVITVFLQVVRNDQSVPGVRIFPRCTHDYLLAVVYTEV